MSDSQEVTQTEAARRLGITPQALGMWAKRPGAPVVLRKGKPFCRWPAFARWREAELERAAREDARPKEVSQTDAERRYEVARAEKLELEVRRMQGELLTLEEAAAPVTACLESLRAQLLTLPQRWAPGLLGCKSLPEMTTRLEQAVREAMETLAEGE